MYKLYGPDDPFYPALVSKPQILGCVSSVLGHDFRWSWLQHWYKVKWISLCGQNLIDKTVYNFISTTQISCNTVQNTTILDIENGKCTCSSTLLSLPHVQNIQRIEILFSLYRWRKQAINIKILNVYRCKEI